MSILDTLGAVFMERPPEAPAGELAGLPPGFAVLLVEVGRAAPPLSPAGVLWLEARLSEHGYCEPLRNFGGLRCLLPHQHGRDDQCGRVGGIYLRRYPSEGFGLVRLLHVAHFHTLGGDVPALSHRPAAVNLGGYRSLEPSPEALDSEADEEGTQGVEEPEPEPEDTLGAWYDAVNPFGPSAELEQRVQEVAATWQGLKAKMDADPKVARMLKPSYDHWLAFWARWQKGDKDQADARAVIADANISRANALGIQTQDDPGKIKDIAFEELSKAKAAGVKIDDAAAAAGIKPGGEWKILAGLSALGALLVAALVVRR